MSILVVTAVPQESDAVVRGLSRLRTATSVSVNVLSAGVGPVAAATATAEALAANPHVECVISAGVAGGFVGRAGVGDLVVATAATAADLGCRTEDGFLTVRDLGLDQESTVTFASASAWADRLTARSVPVVAGEVITLSCMTGTDEEATSLAARHPNAVAEAMEGFGVAWAASRRGIPRIGEIRAISNLVANRDPSRWDLAGAFDGLSRAFAALFAEPLP